MCAVTQRRLWNLFENPHYSSAAKVNFFLCQQKSEKNLSVRILVVFRIVKAFQMSACVQIKVLHCQIFILHTSLAHPVYSRTKTYFLKNPWFFADTFNLQVVAVVSCMFVVVSTLCLIFSTLPRFQQKDENGIIRESSKTMIIIVTIVIGKITKQTLSSSSQSLSCQVLSS